MEFSFGVLTYNSQKFIIETLESIKYQVINFGKEYDCYLIISDDASSDSTIKLINFWLTQNRHFFTKVSLIINEKNKGTVKNYNQTFDAITTEHFHIIAGDDLFSNSNIFNYSLNLNHYDIITTFPINISKTGELYLARRGLERHLFRMRCKNYSKADLMKLQILGRFLHTPSTMYRKQLYSKDIRAFVENFYLFEDDPRWYSFFKITNSIQFSTLPIVLYRDSENSVSHNPNKIMQTDFIKLTNYYIEKSEGFLLRLYLLSELNGIKNNSRYTFSSLFRYIGELLMTVSNMFNLESQELKKKLILDLDSNKKYYDFIKTESAKYFD